MSQYMLARLKRPVMRKTFAAAIALTSMLVVAACSSGSSGGEGSSEG